MEVEATVTAAQLRENPALQRVLKTAETRCVREYREARSFEDVVTRIREARRQEEAAKDAAYRRRAADIHALWGAIDALGWTPPEAAAHLGVAPDYLRRQLAGFGRAQGAELRNWLGRLHEIAFEARVEREHTHPGGTP
jgi:hypothetical protein